MIGALGSVLACAGMVSCDAAIAAKPSQCRCLAKQWLCSHVGDKSLQLLESAYLLTIFFLVWTLALAITYNWAIGPQMIQCQLQLRLQQKSHCQCLYISHMPGTSRAPCKNSQFFPKGS